MLREAWVVAQADAAALRERVRAINVLPARADLPRVQAAGVDSETGVRLAATDPRSGGVRRLGAKKGPATMPDTGGIPVVLAGLALTLAGAAGLRSGDLPTFS